MHLAGMLSGFSKIVGSILSALIFMAGYYLPFFSMLAVGMFFLFWLVEKMARRTP